MPKLWDPQQTRDAEESDGYGVMIQERGPLFWIENRLRGIPVEYWAWTLVVTEEGPGRETLRRSWRNGDIVNAVGFWVPKVRLSLELVCILYVITVADILVAAVHEWLYVEGSNQQRAATPTSNTVPHRSRAACRLGTS